MALKDGAAETVVTPSSRATRRLGLRVFSSPADEGRARRPTDIALLLLTSLGLLVLTIAARAADAPQDDVQDLASHLPVLLGGLWDFFSDLVVVWSALLVLVAFLGRRLRMARDLLLAVFTAGVACGLAAIVSGATNASIIDQLTASAGPPSFPALRFGVTAAVVITASPHLGRPLRYVGRWIVGLAGLASIVLGITRIGGVITALAIASMVAAVVHLLFGSPGGRPSLARVERMLVDLGVKVRALQPAALQPEGVWLVKGVLIDGTPIRVKVYGRDVWDGQFVMSMWRFLWYRDAGSVVPTTRVQLVEHEALMILMARQAGLAAPRVLAAGGSRTGDAVLAVAAEAEPLEDLPDVSDAIVEHVWRALDEAHAGGMALGRIDPGSIAARLDGQVELLDWSGGLTVSTDEERLQDRAQLLVSTAMVVGDDRAIAAALEVSGSERLEELLPYLQIAGMSRGVRRACAERHYDLKALRAAAAERLGVVLPDLVKLRRVTWGSVLQLALLVFASLALINAFSSIDFAAVGDEFREMTLGAVFVGFMLAQFARATGSLSTQGASPVALPFGPLVQLQFVVAYINMAVPSTAGRLALVVRFYQRVGSTAATALGAGALDSFSNFIVQVVLVVVTLAFGLGTVDLQLDDVISQLPPGLLRLVTFVIIGSVVAVAVTLLVPKLRRKVMPTITQFRAGLKVLRSPRHAALLLGGNLLVQVGYALSLGAFTEATGTRVGIFDLLLIINLVGTFASLIPVPNGMGVTEAGLTAGLVAVGVPEPAALAAALSYRVFSSYLPPVWGFFSMRWLQQHDYL